MQKYLTITMIWLLVTAFHSVGAQNHEVTQLDSDSQVELTIKPHICIAPRGESSCISRIDISWQSQSELDLCLHGSISSNVLQCWQQSKSGVFQHPVAIIKDLDYWLRSIDQERVLAHSAVKFATFKPHRKQMRRRNRLPWSIQSL